VLLVVPAGGEAFGLHGVGRWQQEDHGGVGPTLQDLLGALDVDLEEDVGPRRRVWDRGALEVIEEGRPLEEPPRLGRGLEGAAVDEDVGAAFQLAGTRGARRPAAAQPDAGVTRNELARNCALPGPTRADEDEDVRCARGGFSAQSL
jgi:hypothetical protein